MVSVTTIAAVDAETPAGAVPVWTGAPTYRFEPQEPGDAGFMTAEQLAAEATARAAADAAEAAARVAADALKAPLASPAFTGTPTVPTPAANTNTTQAASTAFVLAQIAASIAALVDSSPATLDTLNEIAAALGDDPNLSATLTAAIATAQATADDAYAYADSAYSLANDAYYFADSTATILSNHEANTGNPHATTKTQVGLANVPNTDATNATNIGSGTLAGARIGTSGTRSSATVYRGDYTFSAGVSGDWSAASGTFAGDLSSSGGNFTVSTYNAGGGVIYTTPALRSGSAAGGIGFGFNTSAGGAAGAFGMYDVSNSNGTGFGLISYSSAFPLFLRYAPGGTTAYDWFYCDPVGGTISVGRPLYVAGAVRPGVYTVGTLPSAGTAGRIAYATNARVSGEGVGAGTGSLVADNGAAWKIAGTNTTAVA